MIEKVLPDLYRMEIPLPRNPLKAVNSYLIKDGDRSLIIDTGMNREECKQQMLSNIQELDVDLNRTDFFITHLHADHLALAGELVTESSAVYFNEKEAAPINFGGGEPMQDAFGFLCSNGFPEDELERALKNHPAALYGLRRHLEFSLLRENDIINAGDYSFRCIETPGHSPGHMCLYEPNKRILVAGDHILFDITPNITLWPQMENPLKEYLASLEKVYPLDVDLVLPGHRSIGHDHRKRVEELRQHHKVRLNEILSAIKEGDKTAFDTAPHVSWDVDYKSWELFPPQQKFFAVGETLAHLKYLEEEGLVRRKTKDGKILFSAS